MHSFIRKNSKKFLAVIGVFLMVSFIATARMPSAGERTAMPVGSFGSSKLLSTDVDQAKADIRLLEGVLMTQSQTTQGQYDPLFANRQLAQIFSPIFSDSKNFALLVKEAEQMGITPTGQPADQLIAGSLGLPIFVQASGGRVVTLSSLLDSQTSEDVDYGQQVQAAGSRFWMILQAFLRAREVNKVSRPLRNLVLADAHQSVQVQMVVFDANKLVAKTPAPTTQQLAEQFDKFANTPATGVASSADPFGFGYQIPAKVRLETISITRASLKDVVLKSKDKYDWEVAARIYYDKHQADYPAPKPTTVPTAIAAPTTMPAPTTKPFELVQDQVMDAVMKPDIDALADKVEHAISSTLATDWSTFHAANPTATTMPSTAPAGSATPSSVGPSYASAEYLPALAAKIEKDLGVLPAIQQINQPIAMDEAAKAPGIGSAHSADDSLTFSSALSDPALLPLQPSVPLVDDSQTTYIFRITEKLPAHPPTSMDGIVDTVTANWKLSESFDHSKKDAEALIEAAKKSDLAAAARAANLEVTTPAGFTIEPPSDEMSMMGGGADPSIKGVPLSGEALMNFRVKSRALLSDAASKQPPIVQIDSPLDGKVIVAELSSLTPDWTEATKQLSELKAFGELQRNFLQSFQYVWFSPDSVTQRMGYTDVEKAKS